MFLVDADNAVHDLKMQLCNCFPECDHSANMSGLSTKHSQVKTAVDILSQMQCFGSPAMVSLTRAEAHGPLQPFASDLVITC